MRIGWQRGSRLGEERAQKGERFSVVKLEAARRSPPKRPGEVRRAGKESESERSKSRAKAQTRSTPREPGRLVGLARGRDLPPPTCVQRAFELTSKADAAFPSVPFRRRGRRKRWFPRRRSASRRGSARPPSAWATAERGVEEEPRGTSAEARRRGRTPRRRSS